MNGVYCLTFPNGKKYVGKAVNKKGNGIETRWNRYKRLACIQQPKLYNALKFYGVENVKFEVLLETNDDDNAKRSEMYVIDVWNLQEDKYGYNISPGGDGSVGVIPSQESRNKMRAAKLGRKLSKESIEKRQNTRKERNIPPPALGMKQTEDSKEKISNALKEHLKSNPRSPMSQEIRDKISKSQKERLRGVKVLSK
jgi:group I intron endonuclease